MTGESLPLAVRRVKWNLLTQMLPADMVVVGNTVISAKNTESPLALISRQKWVYT